MGEGSTFTVSLPLGRAHLPQDRIRAARAGVSTATRSHVFVEEATRWLDEEAAGPADLGEAPRPSLAGLTGRVLLADDNGDMRAYVGRLLGDSGHVVEAVGDGQAALAAARRHAPDLVLSDVMMPGLDGFGLLAALRDDPALRGIPVILLSARAGEEARIEGLAAGADDYLIKPFSARELLAASRPTCASPGSGGRRRMPCGGSTRPWRPRSPSAPASATGCGACRRT